MKVTKPKEVFAKDAHVKVGKGWAWMNLYGQIIQQDQQIYLKKNTFKSNNWIPVAIVPMKKWREMCKKTKCKHGVWSYKCDVKGAKRP